ncbi:MAG: radical SAM protein [Deltaproteobacteria bacterium]|nr:radical SAM protein [Deltaproteobacteria bacterium]
MPAPSDLRHTVCGQLCRYHKPGREEIPGCGGLAWLEGRDEPAPELTACLPAPDVPLAGLDPEDPRLLLVCAGCDYRVGGCDFRDPEVAAADCAPCGGLRAVAGLLAAGRDLGLADPSGAYVRLAPQVCLRHLEEPSLYDRQADELYELNEEGFAALARCRGEITLAEAGLEQEFQAYCLEEGLLRLSPAPHPVPLALGPGPRPSLRYLELQVTWRCNLACRHCYLGPARAVDLPVGLAAALMREFEAMGGLRLLVSGGEPLTHPAWPEINALLAALPVRRVLLSNGLLLDQASLAGLNCDEVQISLDGLTPGHEALRGRGTFAAAVAAARRVREAGLDLSVATMIHRDNLGEMAGLEELVRELGAREWGLDAPCLVGRFSQHPELAVTPRGAAGAMARAYGGAYHGGGEGMACGLHLCTVAADGRVAQCGFYLDPPLGRAAEGLWNCWARRRPLALADLTICGECPVAIDCGGGCRFRADDPLGPDRVMCAAMGREI